VRIVHIEIVGGGWKDGGIEGEKGERAGGGEEHY
jgi:hypothetical protein